MFDRCSARFLAAAFATTTFIAATAQVPELIYYKFNEPSGATTVNYAIPGVQNS